MASEIVDSNDDKPKTRFLDIVSKVINNPIADMLLKSNPVGAIVTNVMNVASNFINTTATGGVLKKAVTRTKDVIAQEKLEEFSNALRKYESYYTQLLTTTNSFRSKLDYIESKNINLKVSLNGYHERYLDTLGIDPETGIIDQFNDIFKIVETNGEFNYSEVLNKEQIQNTIEIVEEMPAFESQVFTFIREFEDSFTEYLNQYIEVLKIALTWDDEEIDKATLNSFISSIESYRDEKFQSAQRLNPNNNELITFSIINPNLTADFA